MKRSKKIAAMALAICLLLTMLTGCLKIEISINVKKDGTADVAMIYAMETDMLEEGESAMNEEEVAEYEEQGWTVEEYNEDGYSGVLLKKTNVDFSETELLEGSSGSVRKEGNTCIIDLDVFGGEDSGDFAETASWLKSAGASFVVRMTLPVKADKHNATTVSADGKTLEWDILEMDGTEPLHVEFTAGGGMGKIIGIIAAVIVALLVILGITKSRGKSAPAPAMTVPEEAKPEEANPEEVKPEEAEPVAEIPVEDIPEEVKAEEPAEEETV